MMHIHGNHNTSAMSQRIFKIGLPVEMVSIYLLCCGLADAGKDITTEHLFEIWNGTKDALNKGLKGLEEKNILIRIISDRQERHIYKLTPDSNWRLS
jgi:hypothetical protein